MLYFQLTVKQVEQEGHFITDTPSCCLTVAWFSSMADCFSTDPWLFPPCLFQCSPYTDQRLKFICIQTSGSMCYRKRQVRTLSAIIASPQRVASRFSKKSGEKKKHGGWAQAEERARRSRPRDTSVAYWSGSIITARSEKIEKPSFPTQLLRPN